MDNYDAAILAKLTLQTGLLTEAQLDEARNELGQIGGDPEPFLRFLERKGYLTPWQSSRLLKGDTDGFFLGGYRILYKVASARSGRVFRARNPRTGGGSAPKCLRPP